MTKKNEQIQNSKSIWRKSPTSKLFNLGYRIRLFLLRLTLSLDLFRLSVLFIYLFISI